MDIGIDIDETGVTLEVVLRRPFSSILSFIIEPRLSQTGIHPCAHPGYEQYPVTV